MGSLLPPATGVDACAAIVSALAYLAVAAAATVKAPRDRRAQLFLVIALANLAPYALTVVSWHGMAIDALPRGFWATVSASVGVGTVALFHFTQTYPWRRPWIARHGRWVPSIYIAAGTAISALVLAAPADVLNPPLAYVLAVLAIGIPWVFGVLVVLPFCGLFSLFKSREDAGRAAARGERKTTTIMLVSQLAGGILAIVVIPLLRAAAPDGALITAATLLLTAFGLLMPIAFALAVWKYAIVPITGTAA